MKNFDYTQLDPGVRETVKLLHQWGYRTGDSGDGVTKFTPAWIAKNAPGMTREELIAEGVLDFPHVAVFLSRKSQLAWHADNIRRRLENLGVHVDILTIEASYDPAQQNPMILVRLGDAELKAALESAR